MMEANKSGGVPLSEVESFLEQHCHQCITTACINVAIIVSNPAIVALRVSNDVVYPDFEYDCLS